MKKFGFKSLLLLTVIVLVALAVSVSNYLSYHTLDSNLSRNIDHATRQRIQIESNKVESFLAQQTTLVTQMAELYRKNQYSSGHPERLEIAKSGSGLSALMLAQDNGISFSSENYPGWHNHQSPASLDTRTFPWYRQAINQGEGPIFTDVYLGTSTKKPMISIGASYGHGVLLGDIQLGMLNQIVNAIQLQGVIALIVDNNNTVLASSSSIVNEGEKLTDYDSLKHIADNINQKEQMIIPYVFDGVQKTMYTQAIDYGPKTWHLMVGLSDSVVYAELNQAKKHLLISTLIAVVVSSLCAYLILSVLYRPILKLKETIISLANGTGDLTQRLTVTSQDDLGQMAQGINDFIEHIQSLMIDIEFASTKLKDHTDQLTKQSHQNAQMLTQHSQETEQIVTAIEEMAATADTVAQNVGHAARSTQNAARIGHESLAKVNQAQDKVQNLVNDVEVTATNLLSMNEQSQAITAVLTVIGDIADQTNLLALNAAIEAARAGEQGRGFAVVADEVRALASRTQSSTEEIEQSLTALQNQSKRLVESMEGTKNNCHQTVDNTMAVSQDLGELSSHVAGINDITTQIATAAEQQSSVTQEISRNMNALQTIVNQLDHHGDDVLAQATSLSDINQQLVGMVGQFKLR